MNDEAAFHHAGPGLTPDLASDVPPNADVEVVRELQAAIDKYVEREAVVEHDVEQALNEPVVQESLLRELGKLPEGRSLGRDTLADIYVENRRSRPGEQ